MNNIERIKAASHIYVHINELKCLIRITKREALKRFTHPEVPIEITKPDLCGWIFISKK